LNYVSHTRAAHEHLRRQPEARPHHVSLYWALFFEWNSARFPAALPLERAELTATIRALESFGMLQYKPSRSIGGSCVVMASLGGQVTPEVGQPEAEGPPSSGVTETSEVAPLLGEPVTPVVGQPTPEVTPELGEHSLLYKTVDVNSNVNVGAPPKKNKQEGFADDGLSNAEVIDDTAPPNVTVPTPGAAPKKKVAPKKKGVRAETIRAAVTAGPTEPRRRGGRPLRPETTFQESAIYGKPEFIAAFAGTDYALADLHHYHEAVNLWRDKQTGEPPRRTDWVATAKRFMFNDATDNRLKLAPGVQRHEPGTSPGTAADPGIPTTGYRSKRWD
jgi:hypothetical protein